MQKRALRDKNTNMNTNINTNATTNTNLYTANVTPSMICKGRLPEKKRLFFYKSYKRGGGVISVYKNLCCRFCIVQEANKNGLKTPFEIRIVTKFSTFYGMYGHFPHKFTHFFCRDGRFRTFDGRL